MTPRQLRYFVAIAETGSISTASALLRVAQPALSQHIAVLEAEFGVALLERHARGVSLTAEGRRLQERAGSILAQLEGLRDEVVAPSGKPRGSVRLCLAGSVAQLIAGPLYRYVEAHYPDVRLLLSSALSSEVRVAVETRQVDLALMPNAFELPTAQSRPVYEESFSLFGPATAFADGDETIRFAAIGTRPLVAPDRDHDLRRLMERTAVTLNCPLNVRYEINDPEMCFAIVQEGLACAILPETAALGRLRADKPLVTARRIVEPEIKRVQSIVRVPLRQLTAATEAVERSLEQVVRNLSVQRLLPGTLVQANKI
ncbi:HTH-type transcriptional regulator GltC [Cupriavidus laharis]|uniref:HTH-type transcriptional regulator GltC n=1 Tax=Cupriavidus laharis TaxID=151654 RepID=A0ABN7YGC6_9BURK|nr:LysR family transcriptional regulator [Cupriavidus laharis]CAG9171176.1 HTH-type transcriptional regulator GltC [Cupriavidus laharis]